MTDTRTRLPTRLATRLARPLAVVAVLLLSACAGLTGTVLPPTVDNRTAPIIQRFGGIYADEDLRAYVQDVADRIAGTASNVPRFTVTVLNTGIVNAFALPPSDLYVTRGLLALADSEAQVAGVLAHEMSHILLNHSAELSARQEQAAAAAGVLAATGGPNSAELAVITAESMVRSYGRQQELEADLLGIELMNDAHFDPTEMARFLAKLDDFARLESALLGRPTTSEPLDIFATHPRTPDRVQETAERARRLADGTGVRDVEQHLSAIDGMVYGDTTQDGFVRGRRFIHPQLAFAFSVPEGFHLVNSPRQVVAYGPPGALVVFDAGEVVDPGMTMSAYLEQHWNPSLPLTEVQPLDGGTGIRAATARTVVASRGGPMNVRLAARRGRDDRVYRFTMISSPALTPELDPEYLEIARDFELLSPEEAARYQPYRIAIRTADAGSTAASLAYDMPYTDLPLYRFRVLNGLQRGQKLRPGQSYKIVVDPTPPGS